MQESYIICWIILICGITFICVSLLALLSFGIKRLYSKNKGIRRFTLNGWNYTYDVGADVLHMVKDKGIFYYCGEYLYGDEIDGFENFIVLMRDFNTDEIRGAKILGANKNLRLILNKINKGVKRSMLIN